VLFPMGDAGSMQVRVAPRVSFLSFARRRPETFLSTKITVIITSWASHEYGRFLISIWTAGDALGNNCIGSHWMSSLKIPLLRCVTPLLLYSLLAVPVSACLWNSVRLKRREDYSQQPRRRLPLHPICCHLFVYREVDSTQKF
jgi:hypothetical protein